MASAFGDSGSRRTSNAVRFGSVAADFASLYTTKSGTPLLCQQDGTPFRDPVFMLSTPVQPPLVLFGSSSRFADDGSQLAFCNRFNVQSCLQYLDQVIRFVI